MRVLVCLLLIPALRADEVTQKMTARVSEEADAFIRLATQVLGTETLHQHAQKPPSRFRPRVGAAAQGPPPPEWKERTIVSEYGYVSLAGPPASVHELRQVVSVDGHKVEDAKKAQIALAKTITATDDALKKEMLKQFEKYGLVGAATDFGQLLLLFSRRELERYEFTAKEPRMLGYDRALVFAYKQLDGPEALTLIEANKNDRLRRMKIQGEIWVRSTDFVPMRITLVTSEGDGAASVREEASVDYAMSPFGALLPVSTDHRETRGGKIVSENQFTYTDFHRFGASSDIKFEVAK
jgi:hypothetical protein